jgi:hypothetical protein
MKMLQTLRLSEARTALSLVWTGSKTPRRGVTLAKTANKTNLGEQSQKMMERLCSPDALLHENATNVAPLRGENRF